MNTFEQFLNNISHRFPKGYPNMDNEQDILIIESELNKLGIYLDEGLESTIKDLTGKDKKISKIQTFTDLAALTYQQYDLGDIKKVFPNPVNTIKDWRQYVEKSLSNKGREVENCIKNYAISQNVESKEISKGRGEDVIIGGKTTEIKSMQDNKINTQLQTSFYTNDPDKFYIFVSNTSQKDIDVRVVSSQLLFRAILGNDVVDEIEKTGESKVLLDQVIKGIETLDLKKFIMTSLLTGKTSEGSKSFFIGKDDKIRVRFVIYIEPK
jgi:hypothetical protein